MDDTGQDGNTVAVGLCAHAAGTHEGAIDSRGTAPGDARAWLLIEHPGPWAAKPLDTPGLPVIAHTAAGLGIRVQLIKRPGKRAAGHIYCAWTGDPAPWMLRFDATSLPGQLGWLARGERLPGGRPAGQPLHLVCAHGNRDPCCGRFGGQLSRVLSARGYPVWESTHVGGHRFAPNLVILPEGLYYGPVDTEGAVAAIEAHLAGTIAARGFRGRAGAPDVR